MRKEFRMMAPGTINSGTSPSSFKKGGHVPSIEITINHLHGKKLHSEKKSHSEESRGGYFSQYHETPAYDYDDHIEKHHRSTQPSERDLISDFVATIYFPFLLIE